MLRMYGFDGRTPLRRAYEGITDTGRAGLRLSGPEAVGPVMLDGVPEAHARLMGGAAKTLGVLRWDAGGRTSVEAVRALRMPETV